MVKVGFKHSEESKKKMRGREPWNKGNNGKKESDETRLRKSKAQKGKHLSEETKRKIGEANKGKHNHNYGKPSTMQGKKHTEEAKKKISIAMKGRYVGTKRKPRSEDTKKKISEALIGKTAGEKNWNWKGGVNSEANKIRNSKNCKLWRKSCIERDNFTCQVTGQKGGNLEVHHINNFADFPELRFAIDNGITLSREIHLKFHKIYKRNNNTREQLEEFVKSISS